MNEITLVRELGSTHVEVSTVESSRAWKNTAMLVGVKVKVPHLQWHQYFESAEAARKNLERWNPYGKE